MDSSICVVRTIRWGEVILEWVAAAAASEQQYIIQGAYSGVCRMIPFMCGYGNCLITRIAKITVAEPQENRYSDTEKYTYSKWMSRVHLDAASNNT